MLANLLPADGYMFGPNPTSIDAAIYGFIANIFYFPIETPLRQFVVSQANLVHHCCAMHAATGSGVQDSRNAAPDDCGAG